MSENYKRVVVGETRSLIVHQDGNIEMEWKRGHLIRRKTLTQSTSNRGYRRIGIVYGEKERHMLVHRLVAECFIPNLDGKPQVNHKNGNKADNRLENLEWSTGEENLLHAMRNGMISAKPVTRTSTETGEVTRYRSVREAERENGFGNDTIRNYCCGRRKQPKGYVWEYATKTPADIEAARKEIANDHT